MAQKAAEFRESAAFASVDDPDSMCYDGASKEKCPGGVGAPRGVGQAV